ncbi:DUF3597 domain-containing protein [Sphingobium sp. BYY-5]|uniref:DUF3597 domain-containing protein n=1 Tax=Sphingobium sp. BYY-5 TaxID=2926400 RepID=UPI001FA72CF1|nr:DUF3597 domain-containing protein [Sphingobium sp. BYY-5]MCI4588640.1 DUF3597 domain-containing protein [Sphingobium sp. BYY-5]
MSIFGKIKDAIFGKKKEPEAAAAAPAAPAAPPAGAAAPAAPVAIGEVDVEKILSETAASSGSTLNWRSSIVDLMKLLGIDSSLGNRKELATELGYTGALDGSAEMNIWLHKAVMRELAKNGGKVPTALTD